MTRIARRRLDDPPLQSAGNRSIEILASRSNCQMLAQTMAEECKTLRTSAVSLSRAESVTSTRGLLERGIRLWLAFRADPAASIHQYLPRALAFWSATAQSNPSFVRPETHRMRTEARRRFHSAFHVYDEIRQCLSQISQSLISYASFR
jgi:hypothetical protein